MLELCIHQIPSFPLDLMLQLFSSSKGAGYSLEKQVVVCPGSTDPVILRLFSGSFAPALFQFNMNRRFAGVRGAAFSPVHLLQYVTSFSLDLLLQLISSLEVIRTGRHRCRYSSVVEKSSLSS